MYKFKILSGNATDDSVSPFVASSIQSGLSIFYSFCADRLSFEDEHKEYFLVLVNDDGFSLYNVANYGDFARYIYNLVRVVGGF